LSKQRYLNKNQLQELLLGVGLYIRDLELSKYTDHEETPVPGYLSKSKMAISDVELIERMLQQLFDALKNGSGYVSQSRFYKC